MLLDHVHTRLLLPGLSQLADPDPPTPSTLRTAARDHRQALDQLTQEAGLAASTHRLDSLLPTSSASAS
jgi:hypothetical protein